MKVSLFITCLSDALYPRVGEAMVRLLAKYGVQLDFPTVQTCCGQPAFNSGYWKEARETAAVISRRSKIAILSFLLPVRVQA